MRSRLSIPFPGWAWAISLNGRVMFRKCWKNVVWLMTSVKCVDGSARGNYSGLKTVDGRLPFDFAHTSTFVQRVPLRLGSGPCAKSNGEQRRIDGPEPLKAKV